MFSAIETLQRMRREQARNRKQLAERPLLLTKGKPLGENLFIGAKRIRTTDPLNAMRPYQPSWNPSTTSQGRCTTVFYRKKNLSCNG